MLPDEGPGGRSRQYAIRATLADCASAASGTATRPLARAPMKVRRLIIEALFARQREPEGRPLPYLARDPDLATMHLHELLGQREPEARALNLPALVAAHLPELLEDGLLVLWRDPDAGVGDRDFDRPVGEPGLHPDPPPFRRELHSVGQEVQQDLLDLSFIADELAQGRVHADIQADPMAGGPFLDQRDGIVEGQREVEPGQGQLHPA